MRTLFAAAAALTLHAAPAMADEVADALRAALTAYEAGDVAVAREEAEYAVQLLVQAKAGGLGDFLPEAPDGWTREMGDSAAATGMMAMFGGGIGASASYLAPDGGMAEVQLVADSPMVAAMAAMFSSPAAMGAMGRVQRIQRVNFAVDAEGEIKGLVGGRVLVTVSGSAPEAEKLALIEAMDLGGLGGF